MVQMSESDDLNEIAQPAIPKVLTIAAAVLVGLVVLGVIGVLSFSRNERDAGEAFLAANKSKPGVVVLPSGLQYKIVKEGTGPRPGGTDTVKVHYRGTLVDGTEFDSSLKRGAPASLQVHRVIAGWTEAMKLMPVGSKWELYVPSELGYGARGASPTIPPHATLIFEVELLGIGEEGHKHDDGHKH